MSPLDWYNAPMLEPQELVDHEERSPEPATGKPDARPPLEPPYTKPSLAERLLPFGIMAVVLLLDQLSKYLVETRIPLYGYWAPIEALAGIFRLTHTANSGAVFGLFQGTSMFFAVLAIVVTAAIIYFNFTLPGGQWLLRLALGLQLGGALGNLTDRLRQGHVTDFIDVGPWYIFNLADMAVVSGVILFGVVLLRDERRERAAANAAALNPADSPER
jgi:signal peptidase II